MAFEKGKSGNPAGRPKRDPSALATGVSIRTALEHVVRRNPELVEEAIKRLLMGNRSSLGMLELAAKLNRELQDEARTDRVAIVFTGTLNPDALRAHAKVIECPVESKVPVATNVLSLTTILDPSAIDSSKTQPSVADFTDHLEQVSQPQE